MKPKTEKKIRLEGFWRREKGDGLPRPVCRDVPWKGRREFMKAMCHLEYRLKPAFHKTQAACRVCQSPNGSGEYTHKGWRWPVGLYHYVRFHNVKPSE